jgi:hypothetical protein
MNVPTRGSGSINDEEEQLTVNWIHSVSYFFGGVFLTNAVPHLVSGVMGLPFQSKRNASCHLGPRLFVVDWRQTRFGPISVHHPEFRRNCP